MLEIKSQHLIWVGPLSCREWRWMEIYTDVAEHYTMVANWTKKCKYVWLDEQKWKDHPKVKTLLFFWNSKTDVSGNICRTEYIILSKKALLAKFKLNFGNYFLDTISF